MSWITTSCEEPAIRLTSSIVSSHVEQPALKTSIFLFMIFVLDTPLNFFSLAVGTACVLGRRGAARPRIPERTDNQQPDCTVHDGIGLPHKLAEQQGTVPVALSCSE